MGFCSLKSCWICRLCFRAKSERTRWCMCPTCMQQQDSTCWFSVPRRREFCKSLFVGVFVDLVLWALCDASTSYRHSVQNFPRFVATVGSPPYAEGIYKLGIDGRRIRTAKTVSCWFLRGPSVRLDTIVITEVCARKCMCNQICALSQMHSLTHGRLPRGYGSKALQLLHSHPSVQDRKLPSDCRHTLFLSSKYGPPIWALTCFSRGSPYGLTVGIYGFQIRGPY